jgi:hypothetical protein
MLASLTDIASGARGGGDADPGIGGLLEGLELGDDGAAKLALPTGDVVCGISLANSEAVSLVDAALYAAKESSARLVLGEILV